ncbi:MAG: choline dehydrogenase [Chloroflexi bacterium]|nr:choline dehydrogenase [Chloroflexota bacterium]OJW01871.1 MAG: choline dehydrogenase [Chloroflexi bacterium 54-19]
MYDYLVIGAGSAGCVLANRLTEDPNCTVLLVEAGGSDKKREISIPAAFSKLFKTAWDWAYETQEQPELNNRRLYWPRGKMLGGSSSLNAMIYIRGHRQDYDGWAALGNAGWSFEEVLPYFKKAENQERGASQYHGVGGPLNVSDLRTINPLTQAFVRSGEEAGLKFNPDFNGADPEGVGFYQVTQKRGQRDSTATAYLKPALQRPNLTVITDSQVTRLLVENKKVVGVVYQHNGHLTEMKAGREVLLCGGAINSPQLLLLSGIGPAEHLRSLGIEVVLDLPGVGRNLQDHLVTGVAYTCSQPLSLADAEKLGHVANYLLFRKGPLSSNVAEGGGFVKTVPDAPIPDLQFHFAPVYFINHGFIRPQGHGFMIGPTLIHPKSRGYLELCSADPLAAPLIQPRYLSDPQDWAVLVAGFKLARKIGEAGAFDAYRKEEYLPGPAAQDDEAIRQHISNYSETLYHPTGTCKMGNDEMAVVDSHLRVRGVEGLRVVDTSIMPEIVGGNTNAPVIMIAEKAADLIRAAKN